MVENTITATSKATGEAILLTRDPFGQSGAISSIYVDEDACYYVSSGEVGNGFQIYRINFKDFSTRLYFSTGADNTATFWGLLDYEPTVDELLEDKQVIDDVVSEQVKSRMLPFGMEIASLGVKDIVLPGDMKNILAQLVEAEKSAQANVIRRREETAATRSLLNTAKVMENNPVALRLKELETLERVAERIDNISVFGGLDQVLHGLVNIKG